MSEEVLRTMRAMAWARAKGELDSMMQTYWGENDGNTYQEMEVLLSEFINSVEGNGLCE